MRFEKKFFIENMGLTNLKSFRINVFMFYFLVYIFLGVCLSYYNVFKDDIIFGLDIGRVYHDLTKGASPRISLHPLFPLLCQTPVLAINGVINHRAMSIIIVEAACGALSNLLFYSILWRRKIDLYMRLLFTLIFGFSFSCILFSTVTETYIFSCTGLISFWYFISIITDEKKNSLSHTEISIMIIFGIVTFGITLTNYIFYLLGVFYILSLRYKFKKIILYFISLNFINGFIIYVLCLYQKLVWKSAPYFWTYLYNLITGSDKFEYVFMNFSISISKITYWFISTFCYPLLYPSVELRDAKRIWFSQYPALIKVALSCFFIMLIIRLAGWLWKTRILRYNTQDVYILFLFTAYIGNIIFHFIYGFMEPYLYSPHYLFYILLVFALISGDKHVRYNLVYRAYLAVFFGIEAINNIYRFFETATMALSTLNSGIKLAHALKGTILCATLSLILVLLKTNCTSKKPHPLQTLYGLLKYYCFIVLGTSGFILFKN